MTMLVLRTHDKTLHEWILIRLETARSFIQVRDPGD